MSFLTEAVAKFPTEPELRVGYAWCLTETQPAQARREALFAAGLPTIEGDAQALTRLAGLLLSLGEYAAAESCARRAAAAAPREFFLFACELARILGLLACRRGENERGERYLREAHELDPTRETAARDLAVVLVEQGRLDEALDVIERTLATPPPAAHHREGLRSGLREVREAIRRGRGPARRLAPPGSSSTPLPLRALKGSTRSTEPDLQRETPPTPRRAGSTSERLAQSLRLLKLDMATQDPARLATTARGALELGMRDAALLCVDQAAQGHPSDPRVIQQLNAIRGAISLLDEDHVAAEPLLRTAYSADPTDPTAVGYLCALLDRQGRYTEALELINHALAQATREQTGSAALVSLDRTRRQLELNQSAGTPRARPAALG